MSESLNQGGVHETPFKDGGSRINLALLASILTTASGSATAASKPHSASSPPKVVKIAWPEQVQSLDPDLTSEALPYDIMALMGGTLTTLSANGKSVEPGLASKWTASSNGLTWTFTLRKGCGSRMASH